MYPILVERPICSCEYCGMDLFEGNDLYDCDGDKVCEDCAREWMEEELKKMKRTLSW